SGLSAAAIVDRDRKEYGLSSGQAMSISQVETVGTNLFARKEELLEALEGVRQKNDYLFATLMVTDIVNQGTKLLCAGDRDPVGWAFGSPIKDDVIDLPGVMSRKKQVAPKLLAVF
ncbi:MAG: hypothetical protein JOZ19_14075, partial [Rubrobacter sp.]|nr:hypothetical protein [Rubrobacter sp.]